MQMKNYKEHKDSILVDMTLLGDERAFEELVRRHEKNVKGTAFKTTGNTFSAEDAAQDAFVSAWLNLDTLSDREKFGSWVCSIAKNHARNLVRKYKNAAADISLSLLEEVDLTGSDESGLYELLSSASIGEAERDSRLHEALETLSEKIRETVYLHYFEGLSVAQIAERLCLVAGTVKWRLSEGRRQLRKEYGIMEKDYNESEDIITRVMRQVKNLKLWTLKIDKSGFEKDYESVLENVTALADSEEKSHALADVLLRGYWWLPGKASSEILAEIKDNAIKGRNEYVLSMVLFEENARLSSLKKQIDNLRGDLIPWCEANGFTRTGATLNYWLARMILIRDHELTDECLFYFKQVLALLPPSDVYHALAAATLDLFDIYGYSALSRMQATGEEFHYIDGKLYFWQQPGFGRDKPGLESAIFFYASCCDSLILDENMQVGDTVVSECKRYTLSCISDSAAVNTPAGLFENCKIFRLDGPLWTKYRVETAFCEGVGIVKQTLSGDSSSHEWLLAEYDVTGDGLLPLRVGNKWKYICAGDKDAAPIIDSSYRVTFFDGKAAILAHHFICEDTLFNRLNFRGNMLEAVSKLYREVGNGVEPSRDSIECIKRALDCAETDSQRIHAQIAQKVAENVCEYDESNPDYTEKSIRDWFEIERIVKKEGRLLFSKFKHREFKFGSYLPFELTKESYPVMYNTPYSILCETTGSLWNDKWVDGYYDKGKTKWGRFHNRDYRIEVAEEDCETSLGVFKNCRRVFVNVAGMPQGYHYRGGHKTYWFAPGIGIVKYTALHHKKTCISTWELTEYRGEGSKDEYFPLGDGFFRRYEAIDMHQGYRASVEYTYCADGDDMVIFRNAAGRMKKEVYEEKKQE